VTNLEFEGKDVPVEDGDTVASALYRSGVRTFSRSFKYHRPRGLYCVSGDCPNCLVTVDGEVDIRACECAARAGQTIVRQNAWPNADRDALVVTDYLHKLLPVGFYYKTLAKPKFAWPIAEKLIRHVAGLGKADKADTVREGLARVHRHPDVLVIGAGVAGLSAALAAAEGGKAVLLLDEHTPGYRVAPGPTKTEIERLAAEVAGVEAITTLWDAPVVGLYEGPLAVAVTDTESVFVHPQAIVVASGGMETHRVFAGNDLPGVFLARGAARLAGVHGVRVGDRAVVWVEQPEALEHVETLRRSGVAIAAIVAPDGFEVDGGSARVLRGEVTKATGRRKVEGVVVGGETIPCELLVIGSTIQSNAHLPRLSYDLPVVVAGDAATPGASLEEAVASGRSAGEQAAGGLELLQLPANTPPAKCGDAGYVCICEDVSVNDVTTAIGEGFDSAELLKRYTTVTMGPCQGRLCADQLRAIAERTTPAERERVALPTTLRPPVRPLTLEMAAAGASHHVERHTRLRAAHAKLGATFMWAGPWKRVEAYGGDVEGEYRAVRERVGVIDVGTLGKFLVAGPDAGAFLDRLYPMRVSDLQPGRLRYGLMLEEGGVIIDDGTVLALGDGRYYCTVTTSGAERLESWMLDWAEAWGHSIFVVNQTSSMGAINVAGPRSRELLAKLSDDDLTNESFPYLRHQRITVAGVPCIAMRIGFVGELAYELHFPSSQSQTLWDAVLEAGAEWQIRPFGVLAQRLLRLEKGHIIVSQDTDFETLPSKVGMGWAVKMDKDDFIGKAALARLAPRTNRETLVPWTMAKGAKAPPEGSTITIGGKLVGRVTSAGDSIALGHPIGLAWIATDRATDGAAVTIGGQEARIQIGHAFYDPEGAKLRA
jgi:sarcosine oxidase, subunit alpha